MKAEIFKEEFKKALSLCERVTKRALGLPVLQNVLIKAENGFLELTTTNLETTIKVWVLAKIKKAGELTVPASFFSSLVNFSKSEKIDILEEGGNLLILSENQESQIPIQSAQDFPLIPKIDNSGTWKIASQELSFGLSQLIDIPAISQNRPEITGVFFSFKKDKLRIASTDGFRLAEKIINIQEQSKVEGMFILPQNSTREVLNALSQEEGQVSIYFNENQAVFEIQRQDMEHIKLSISSRLIEGVYPPYQEIIPKSSSTQIRADKELLISQVKQAGLFSGKVSEVRIKTVIKDGKIKISSQTADVGRNESFVDAQITGGDVEIAFNYRFLLGGLNSIKSSEVVMEFNGPDKSGILRAIGDNSFLYILMPLQT